MSNEFSVNHVCVGLRQIAMLFEQSTIDILVPAQLQMPNIHARLTSLSNDLLYDKLTQLMTHREFALLWTAPELLRLLRTRCLLCGSFHPPARMMEHLNLNHHEENKWATQFLFQLLPCLRTQQHTDYQCNCCTLVYNLPATPASIHTERASLQTAHFETCCPVARQIALILLPPHGRPSSGSAGQGTDEQPAGSGSIASGHQKRPRDQRPRSRLQETQTNRRRRTAPSSDPAHASRHGPDAQSGSAAGDQPRTEPQQPVPSGLLRYVRTVGPTGGAADPERAGPQMERTGTTTTRSPAMADNENLPAGWPHEGTLHQSRSTSSQQDGGSLVGHRPAEGHIDSGWQLGLSALVAGSEPVGTGSEGAHADAENDENPGDGERTPPTQLTRHQVPQPEGAEGCRAVVFTTDPPGSGTMATDADHHSLHHLESPGYDSQAAQSTDVQTGNSLDGAAGQNFSRDTERSRQGQAQEQDTEVMTHEGRQKLRACILQLTLGNTSTACYANSALLCYLWASLSRVEFQLSDWGTLSAHFWELLHSASDIPMFLNQLPWFQSLVDTWSERYSQADSAEFTHRFLTRVDTPIASNAWRRMVLMGKRRSSMTWVHVTCPSLFNWIPIWYIMTTFH